MPSSSESNAASGPRNGPEWSMYEATILALADTTRGSLWSSIDAFAPPKEKRTALRGGIEFGAFTLSCISALISELQAKIRILHDGYDKLRSSINLATNTLMSPIFCLPDEILVDIMLSCSPPDPLPLISSHTRAWFPSALIMVSRKWRELIYSSPSMWSSFQVHFGEIPLVRPPAFPLFGGPGSSSLRGAGEGGLPNDVTPFSRLVDRHLTLSTPITLTIWLSASYSVDRTTLRNICAHSERWQTLLISRGFPTHILNEDCPHHLPKLRSLHIFVPDSMVSQPITAFDNAPELRSLTLNGFHDSHLSPHFPWHQLTHLILDQRNPHNMPLLPKARNLIILSLRSPESTHILDPTYQDGQTPLFEPFIHLRRLLVATLSLPIVTRLVAPNLERLYVHGGTLCRPAADLLGRSACRLTTLAVVTSHEPHAIDQLLTACPSLVLLRIQAGYACINTVCTLLSNPTIVPHLKYLVLVYAGHEVETSPFLRAHPALRTTGPCQIWTPSISDSETSSIPSVALPPQPPSFVYVLPYPPVAYSNQSSFDDTSHVDTLAAAVKARLTTLQFVGISNPITKGIVSTLSSFASQGIIVKIFIGWLPEEVRSETQHRVVKYGQVSLTY